MTASKDGSMKFWVMEKAGMARKYVPNFDRTEHIIHHIYTTDFTAITTDKELR